MLEPTDFAWDGGKAESNLAKHGIPFSAGVDIFLDRRRVELEDTRKDYGERRMNVVGMVDGVCLTVTCTMRKNECRIISVRRASRKERGIYDNRA